MNTFSTSPACAVLTELRDWGGIKAIADYAGFPSTREETKVLAPWSFELQTCPCLPPLFAYCKGSKTGWCKGPETMQLMFCILSMEANLSTTRATMCTLMHPTLTSLLTYSGMGSPELCDNSGRGRGWGGEGRQSHNILHIYIEFTQQQLIWGIPYQFPVSACTPVYSETRRVS